MLIIYEHFSPVVRLIRSVVYLEFLSMGIYTTFLKADDILLIWHYIIYVKKSPLSKQQRGTDATQLRLNYAFGTSVIRAREQTVIIGKKRGIGWLSLALGDTVSAENGGELWQ